MKEGQELVDKPATELSVFNEYEQEIVQFEQYFADKEYDLTCEEGVKSCEGDLLLLRKVEIRIDKTRKSRGKHLRDAVTDLNASAKVCHNRVHTMYETVDAPLQVVRQAELNAAMDKMEAEKAELKAIEDKRLADLEAREAKMAAKEAEQQAKDDAAQAVRDAAERKEELEAAALLAAENARLQAEHDAVDAAEQAKQDQADAVAEVERKAKADADILAKEIADKYAKEQAEQRRIDADILVRQQDVEHRKDFNNAAALALQNITHNREMSVDIVKAIVSNEIPNITMNY